MRRVGLAFALAGVVMAWVPNAPVLAEPDAPAATQPGAGATTAPGTSVTIAAPATSPAKVRSLADRLAYTDIEKTVIDATRDGVRQIDETGLYVMLGVADRARGNLQLDPEEWSQLDRPAYTSLLAEPKRWRGHPLQATAAIFRVTKMMSGKELNYSDFWPKDRTVWRLDGVMGDDQAAHGRPIIIFSVVNPSEYLGAGKPGEAEGQTEYKRGPLIRAAAIFYKDLIDTDRDGAERHYPVMMAWQLSGGDAVLVPLGSSNGLTGRLAPVVILLVIMAGGFYFLRRRITQLRKQGSQGPKYRPLRDEIVPAAAADGGEDSLDGHVDPALAAAVEQYLHEKGHDEADGTHAKDRRG